MLFFAFAFAVIADPVSSVAYAIEAALRALHGDLALLLPTMTLVIGLVLVSTANYWQLVRRFPRGGGVAAAAGRAFGPRWTFLPIGALVVDFVLTIGISIAAAASAVIALLPDLAPWRVPIALLLLLAVAGLTWFGHGGRLLFAVMTVAFVAVSVIVLVIGFLSPHTTGHAPQETDPGRSAAIAVVLAFPVAMALATGVEAPSTAIAQLDDTQRRRFGRGTLALLLVIVGGLTLALTALAVRLHIGIPEEDSTQIADIAHAAAGSGWLYGAFQLTSSLLLRADRPGADAEHRQGVPRGQCNLHSSHHGMHAAGPEVHHPCLHDRDGRSHGHRVLRLVQHVLHRPLSSGRCCVRCGLRGRQRCGGHDRDARRSGQHRDRRVHRGVHRRPGPGTRRAAHRGACLLLEQHPHGCPGQGLVASVGNAAADRLRRQRGTDR
ncbi:amino acid permease [Streptomyces sp. enrichment culture]|uniref:amino acid permease n=1 Tax=Streptomyces sp. enrichment culture TaxID=1795815 RepID=UPI003F57B383